MARSGEHNKLIHAAASNALGKLGLRQRGRSRTWLDDHGWWLIVVEFQPSSWARGTYLNVGAMWLWRPINHIAFEFGHRVGDFIDAEQVPDFAASAHDVAERAAIEVLRLRKLLATPADMAHHLAEGAGTAGLNLRHAAIAAALAGAADVAKEYLERIAAPEQSAPEWLHQFWTDTQELRQQLTEPTILDAQLTAAVRHTRRELGLSSWTGVLPWTAHTAA